MVSDQIEGNFRSGVAHYIFHPTLSIEVRDFNSFIIKLQSEKKIILSIVGGEAKLENTQCASEFGKTYKTKCLNIYLHNRNAVIIFSWVYESNAS
jgi:hypothetical protein